MTIKLDPTIADLTFEGAFREPDFHLFQDAPSLLRHMFKRLAPRGLHLADLRLETGSGSLAERPQVVCHLFNYWMTIRVNVERIEIVCSQMPRNLVESYKIAIVDAATAVTDHRTDLSFKTFVVTVGLHSKLEGSTLREYLGRFAGNAPQGLGPLTGNGAVFYFGPESERLLASVALDVSAAVPDAAFVRVRSVWDGQKVAVGSLLDAAERYTRDTLERVGLELPT